MPEFCGIALDAPGRSTPRAPSTRSPRGKSSATPCWRFPFAAFVSKTITPEPRAGNAPQRIWETPGGMINSIGLPNKGLEGFLAEDLPQLAELPVPLIVSVMATNREDFAALVEAVGGSEEVAAIELNVSCPNVALGADRRRAARAETEALLEALRPLTDKPLIVKLTPNVADPAAVAAARRAGRGGRGLADQHAEGERDRPAHREPALGGGHGGLSGPAVRPVALAAGARGGRARWRCRSSAWAASAAAPTRANFSPPGRRWSRSGRRISATRERARGSRRELARPASRAARSPRPRYNLE